MKILKSTVLSAAALSAMALGANAQVPERPKLVVGIVVDQLRTDYLEVLQGYFGEKGFKALLRDGVYMRDVDFKVPGLDAVNSTAMLQTGAYPSVTGVPADAIYDASSLSSKLRMPLAHYNGSTLTNDSFTPGALRLSTISDELVIDSRGLSNVYSVAVDPQQAVILAGHNGKGAFWINNSTGNWATTSYYGTLPASLSNRNMRSALSQRVDTMQWRKYRFSRQDRDVYRKFAASPLANREVTDVAIELINGLNLGSKSGTTDMLNVAYTLAPYKYSTESSPREELTDAYRRLDTQIGRLIEAVDRKVGASNAIIWLTSTGYYDDALPVEDKYRLPVGEFSSKKAKSLLNSYLSAKYGSGAYVATIRDGQVFFDRKVMEAVKTDPETIISDAKMFLVKMNGVADAYTLSEIIKPSTGEIEALRLSIDPGSSGDIILKFTPGVTVAYDDMTPPQTRYVREAGVMTPAVIRAPGLKSKVISTTVDAVQLAPTVAGQLRIRAPNGASAKAEF